VSGGLSYDRSGHRRPTGPPLPGVIFRPSVLSRLAMSFTAVSPLFALLAETPSGAPGVVLRATAVLLVPVVAYRFWRVAEIKVGSDCIRVQGLLHSKTLSQRQVIRMNPAGVQWRTRTGRARTWHLWPYLYTSGLLNDTSDLEAEVWSALERLIASWSHGAKSTPFETEPTFPE